MSRDLYTVLVWLAQPLVLCKLWWRGFRERGYWHALPERFGWYATPPASAGTAQPATVWIHAVSLGEMRAAIAVIAILREQLPTMRLLLTHGTATGLQEGAKCLRPGDAQAWLPWDTPGAVARFLDHHRPALGILMETELWPNLVWACRQRNIPLALANARLSARSLRKAARLGKVSRDCVQSLAALWVQTAHDARRFRWLGARVDGVWGNLKFDLEPDVALLERGKQWKRRCAKPVIVLASSREGEERALLTTLRSAPPPMQARLADVQWLIVPRHPQRFHAVAREIESAGWHVERRSAWGTEGPAVGDREESMATGNSVWLGDSIGEMPLYYGLASTALLGGSFLPFGGQNLIEAAACGCPVVMGPYTFHFAQPARQAIARAAAWRACDLAHGVDMACALATNPVLLDHVSACSHAFAREHRGATLRLAQAIRALLERSAGVIG
ncbi:3-deoxy-D-manno-octulosonic acid transferase [Candidatus Symbiobacter mobilis]|uniref:3-deoxy-D-manno-octulosonic acid transferase n=1 Tax=Candidatus Symbiobacter mobilis TaxID=1436290 RepID=UPI0009DBFE11|nr:3-deoxy-D-manno-octulosonic acid transferase [Candidatus Symbiobacter mobilis]